MEHPPDMNFQALELYNFYNRASADWRAKHYIGSVTGKVTARTRQSWDAPWDYIGADISSQCGWYQELAEIYQIVPPHCLDCWKVVVRPRTHAGLIKLRNMMRAWVDEDPDCLCKCGIELRTYVPGLYGGYFYNRGKEAGLKRLDEVRRIVYKAVGLSVPVYLKRYCTEFENVMGDSGKYHPPEYAKAVSDFFLNSKEASDRNIQSNIIKLNVYHKWMKFGWKYGTLEDRKEIEDTYNGGEPLNPKPRQYERE